MEDKRFEVLKAMKDHYDHLYSRIYYLFAAHGAGFAGSLTILKEYASAPQYDGVGIPIALFGGGLIAAIAAYITLALAQMKAKNAALSRGKQEPSMTVFYIHYGGLAISIIFLIAAIAIIIWRTARL